MAVMVAPAIASAASTSSGDQIKMFEAAHPDRVRLMRNDSPFADLMPVYGATGSTGQTTNPPPVPSDWTINGMVDTNRVGAGGVDYKMFTFQNVLGVSRLHLDLHSFLGTTKGGAMVEAFTLGGSFPLATGVTAFVSIGGDQVGGFSRPAGCLSGGINWVH